MRKPWLMLLALLAVVIVSGCSTTASKEAFPSELSAQETADKFVTEVMYFKDPTTNLCFAYYWSGTYHGGAAIVLVPEDSIPQGRLLIGRPIR